ncbi:MAG: hypothetical protein KAQ74_04275 [Dehalococcoidia bacterium]|nr:hypothetical protein [Dehalococcoidia bacterium]
MSGRTHRVVYRLLGALVAVPLLLVMVPMAFVSAADQQDYDATQIKDWLVDKIETTTVEVTTPPR